MSGRRRFHDRIFRLVGSRPQQVGQAAEMDAATHQLGPHERKAGWRSSLSCVSEYPVKYTALERCAALWKAICCRSVLPAPGVPTTIASARLSSPPAAKDAVEVWDTSLEQRRQAAIGITSFLSSIAHRYLDLAFVVLDHDQHPLA
jgi:hypothetical protein